MLRPQGHIFVMAEDNGHFRQWLLAPAKHGAAEPSSFAAFR